MDKFSGKELIILNEIINGASNAEISNKLNISTSTVKVYVKQIFQKLNVNNRIEAEVKAVYLFLSLKNNSLQK